jgi:hypothetical protein
VLTADYSDGAMESKAPHSRWPFACPFCDATGDVERKADPERWLIGSFSTKCPGGAECLQGIASEVGARPYQVKDDPLRWLDPFLIEAAAESTSRAPAKPAPLPSPATLAGLAARLVADGEALPFLRARGVAPRVARRFGLGYDGRAIILPVFEDGVLVNVRRRFLRPGDGPKVVGLRARPCALYPDLPRAALGIALRGRVGRAPLSGARFAGRDLDLRCWSPCASTSTPR